MKWAVAISLVLAAAACRDPARPNHEFIPEMVDSVPHDPFDPHPALRGGRAALAPAPGTVARGQTPFHYGPGPEEAARAGRELRNPVAPGPQAVARGEKVYRAMCAVCHGPAGHGDGPVVPRFPAPPSLHAARARRMTDGQIVHVIARGQGLMPSHAAQVAPTDRWNVVHYIRSLQARSAGEGVER